ncbi:MAG: hypothetical protein LBE62_00710 [Azonexus sp.]|jgi:hypothetical protein|nr:hypothetical protein [Azonexus sp.]
MSNIENLMLEHLKKFQATLERMENKIDEHSIRMDRIIERIERIERRLELQ